MQKSTYTKPLNLELYINGLPYIFIEDRRNALKLQKMSKN